MKIVIIAPEVFPVPPIRGGAVETWIYKVAKELQGENINIFSLHEDPLPINSSENNLHYFRYKRSWLDDLLLCTYKLPFKNSKTFLYWFLYSYWCARNCKKINAQIIHIHNRWQFIPIIKKLNPDAKILFHVHQLSALNFSDGQVEILRGKIDGYIGCSHFMTQQIRTRFHVGEEKVFLVQNGVDVNEFCPIAQEEKAGLRKKHGFGGEKIVLFAGRLVENKGAHILMQAFNKLVNTNIDLCIVGSATYSEHTKTEYIAYLEGLAKEKKENVKFLGFKPHDKMAEIFKMADIFVFPSQVEEALGMSLIEAMSVGLGVIGSDRGGISDLIDDKINGLLVKDHADPGVWAEKISLLLDDSNLCHNFGIKAREKIENHFTWQRVSWDLSNAYQNFLN